MSTIRVGDHCCGICAGPSPATGFCFETGFNDITVPDARANRIEAERPVVKITGQNLFPYRGGYGQEYEILPFFALDRTGQQPSYTTLPGPVLTSVPVPTGQNQSIS